MRLILLLSTHNGRTPVAPGRKSCIGRGLAKEINRQSPLGGVVMVAVLCCAVLCRGVLCCAVLCRGMPPLSLQYYYSNAVR